MRTTLIALASAALLLAGCSSDSDEPAASAPPSASAAPTTPATTAPASATPLVEGEDYDVVAALPATIEGSPVQWSGVDAGGTAFGGIDVPDPAYEQGRMGPVDSYAQPVLMTPTGQLTRMTPVRDSGVTTQMLGGDANDDWVTWFESADTSIGMGSWTLYSYERSTKTLRTIATYEDDVVGKNTFLDYDGRPEILGDDVVMGTAGIGSSGKGSAILTVPLDGSAPLTRLVARASEPDVDENGFSFLQGWKRLMYRDTSTGDIRQLHTGAGRGECHFYRSGVLVTCDKTSDGEEVTVAGPEGTRTFGPFRSGVSYVELRDGWARFVEDADGDPQIYAVDAATETLHHVSASQNLWRLVGHGYALVVQVDDDREATGYQLIKLR
ncbi:MAG: hypothetical protein ABWY58_01490 [Aeromicrobium sp.]